MRTPASIKDHPIHPMLIAFPIGLWGFSFACDLLAMKKGRRPWRKLAEGTLQGGILTACAAAVPGFIDFLSIKNKKVKKIGTTHLFLNLLSVASYTTNYFLRKQRRFGKLPVALSAATMAALGVSGWLGGTMVYKHHVGISHPPMELRAAKKEQQILQETAENIVP